MLHLVTLSVSLSSPIVTRRHAVCSTGVGAACFFGVLPFQAIAEPPLTASQMLTAGQYLNDLSDARAALKADVAPLIERQDGPGYDAVRITIRKPPINSVRKACSKVVKLLEDNGMKDQAKAKDKVYESIKVGLGAIDDGCRPDLEKRPDLMALLTKLEDDLAQFGEGLGIETAKQFGDAL